MEFKKLGKLFLYSSKPKINYKIFCNALEEGSLKVVRILM